MLVGHEIAFLEVTHFQKDNLMTTPDFITELFCRVDDAMPEIAKHPQAKLYPSEVVTLGLLLALKGRSFRLLSVG